MLRVIRVLPFLLNLIVYGRRVRSIQALSPTKFVLSGRSASLVKGRLPRHNELRFARSVDQDQTRAGAKVPAVAGLDRGKRAAIHIYEARQVAGFRRGVTARTWNAEAAPHRRSRWNPLAGAYLQCYASERQRLDRVARRADISGATAAVAVIVALSAAAAVAALALARGETQNDAETTARGETQNDAGNAETTTEQTSTTNLEQELSPELAEALRDFGGDLKGPWQALGIDIGMAPDMSPEEIRVAYRLAVRTEHPDTSTFPDAEARFGRVRKAYALLADAGTRALLLEAAEMDVVNLEDLSKPERRKDNSVPRAALLLTVLVAALLTWQRISSMDFRIISKQSRAQEIANRQQPRVVLDSSEGLADEGIVRPVQEQEQAIQSNGN